jgi:hypothetical protein
MKIKPCPSNAKGEHDWRFPAGSKRNSHGNRKVVCANCSENAQESANGIKFTTSHATEEVKTVTGSYRTWKHRKDEFLRNGYTGIQDYIDTSPVLQKQPIL